MVQNIFCKYIALGGSFMYPLFEGLSSKEFEEAVRREVDIIKKEKDLVWKVRQLFDVDFGEYDRIKGFVNLNDIEGIMDLKENDSVLVVGRKRYLDKFIGGLKEKKLQFKEV